MWKPEDFLTIVWKNCYYLLLEDSKIQSDYICMKLVLLSMREHYNPGELLSEDNFINNTCKNSSLTIPKASSEKH